MKKNNFNNNYIPYEEIVFWTFVINYSVPSINQKYQVYIEQLYDYNLSIHRVVSPTYGGAWFVWNPCRVCCKVVDVNDCITELALGSMCYFEFLKSVLLYTVLYIFTQFDYFSNLQKHATEPCVYHTNLVTFYMLPFVQMKLCIFVEAFLCIIYNLSNMCHIY